MLISFSKNHSKSPVSFIVMNRVLFFLVFRIFLIWMIWTPPAQKQHLRQADVSSKVN